MAQNFNDGFLTTLCHWEIVQYNIVYVHVARNWCIKNYISVEKCSSKKGVE